MSTKRALIPFTQKTPLFTERRLGEKDEAKSVLHGDTIYSDEIFAPSEHGFATLAFQYYVDVLDTTGTLTVKAEFKIPGTSTWIAGTTIATITNPTELSTTGVMYRLDAVLNVNWFPNATIRFSFALAANLATDKITVRGAHIV